MQLFYSTFSLLSPIFTKKKNPFYSYWKDLEHLVDICLRNVCPKYTKNPVCSLGGNLTLFFPNLFLKHVICQSIPLLFVTGAWSLYGT